MSVALRIGTFAAGLAALFAGAFALGGAVDPDVERTESGHGDAKGHRALAGQGGTAPVRLEVERSRFVRGERGELTFRVVDRDGAAVEDFDVVHERAMHVIAVRRDLTGYQHLHPRRAPDGRWTVDVRFPESGPHRIYADFSSRGEPRTLSADLDVEGRYAPRPLPAPAATADAGDGYEAAVHRHGAERSYTVTKDGVPVDDLEPYLGARGHLVAIAERDLAFQHVHPKDRATAGREIRFDVALADPGRYRLFLQFKHDGEVRTAAFSERATAPGGADHGEAGHGH